MKAIVIIDAQNEFSAEGQRPVPEHEKFVNNISARVKEAREKNIPIAWVKHYNLPNESRAFVPGDWGSELSNGMGPIAGSANEALFEKSVFGAFSGSSIGSWLKAMGADTIVIMGFYSHGCVSTTTREALMAGLEVWIDPETTGTCAVSHELLGQLSAEESKKAALLQLYNMGATIFTAEL